MRKISIILVLSIFVSNAFSQSKNNTLLTIDGKDISAEEFLRVYKKNNNITAETEKKSIDEYYDLFVNYKLKVVEAENRGYDTVKSFIKEFSGYRDQLAKPYLQNSGLKEDLIKEAYERYIIEINASHILVTCPEDALPKDTLKAYNKIAAIRARVVGGEPFEEVAKATSDDPSVKDNEGKLGYFSVFRMVYPFETGAYNTKTGEISEIIRTSYGYHIIKVNDKRDNRGTIKAAHLMTRIPQNASEPEIKAAEEKIQKAYMDLLNGKSWSEAVKEYSENPRTKEKDGEIGWLRSGQAPDEFLEPCYAANIGGFTKPIMTRGGYHIGYVIDKKPVENFEEAIESITKRVERDQSRKEAITELQYSELKNKYKITLLTDNLNPLFELLDSTLYKRNWNPEKAANLSEVVVKIEDKTFSISDYAQYLSKEDYKINSSTPLINIAINQLEDFSNKQLYIYAMDQLPVENMDYKYLLQEYHDGILLFNLTNDLVWNKAQIDTTGLEAFYKETDKYQWNDRIEVNIYKYADNSITTKLPALAKKQVKKKLGVDFLNENLCNNDSIPCIEVERKIYEKGQDAMADKLPWEKGGSKLESDQGSNYFYYVLNTKGKQDKKLEEARGLYISDYQSFLEKEWIKELRAKYSISLNEAEFEKIKSELK